MHLLIMRIMNYSYLPSLSYFKHYYFRMEILVELNNEYDEIVVNKINISIRK